MKAAAYIDNPHDLWYLVFAVRKHSIRGNYEEGSNVVAGDRRSFMGIGRHIDVYKRQKLDDLQCAFASLKAFLADGNDSVINVYCCFDNEEVGSNTKQGAMSTFLYDVLQRINENIGGSQEAYRRAVAASFMVSCDNAHAVHPNHPEKTDAENRVFMNKGIVLKESANQKYTTDALSRAVFSEICRKAQVPVQSFANRSDNAGGSTLGNLSNTQVSVNAVDIGLAQLAMHSSYETAGALDTDYAVKALTQFYESDIRIEEDRITIVK